MKTKYLSPIVLFTYLRLDTLKKTVNALANNVYAIDSDLIIFSDGAKHEQDEKIVSELRSYLKNICGFKTISIHESKTNLGLALSIQQGITSVFSLYTSVIVLEDDLITTKNFLAFMNASLNRYEDEKGVFSISGYSFDFSTKLKNEEGYFLNRPNSWGWATWRDRWESINWEIPNLNKDRLNELSVLGSDVKKMVEDQKNLTIDSWHVKFIYNQFLFSGLTYYPNLSKVENIGFDEFATHTKNSKRRFSTKIDNQNLLVFDFPKDIKKNNKMQKELLRKMSLMSRLINRILISFTIRK